MGKKLTTQEFIDRAIKVHGNKYDYSDVVYVNAKIKVKILCPIHGEFQQTPDSHTNMCGCPQCNPRHSQSLLEFINNATRIHNNKYDYETVQYINSKTHVNVTCKIHGIFSITPNNHLRGKGCKQCAIIYRANNRRQSTQDIITKAQYTHGNRYDYSVLNYIHRDIKIDIICKIHGIFKQHAKDHINGQGCPKCRISKGESKIMKILDSKNIKYDIQYKFNECKYKQKLPFDFYLYDNNMCIEYDGEFHYKPARYSTNKKLMLEKLEQTQRRDNIKTQYCIDNNIKLLRIPYWEFNNIEIILKRELT